MEFKRVVVTGLGALTPIGNTVSDYWNGLINGVSGAALIKSFDTEKFKTKFACEVKHFDADGFLGRKDARKLDPFVQYALFSTEEAVKDAGLDFSKLDTSRIGVIWGSGIGGLKTFLDEVTAFAKGDGSPRFNPFFIPKMIADIAPGHISIKYGLRGPNFTTVSACASSNNSLIDSFNYIRLGKANMFISGGSEAIINEAGIGGFNAMHALSTRNDDPATASRPFDLDRDGFVAGEGAGTIILEELEHAKARGAKIYAEMVGGGMSADAYHMTAPHPDGLGAAFVMRAALEDANLSPADIDYVNVHGTSTPIGDPQEIKAIQDVFGDDIYRINISSTKSMTGHLLGAAGAVEAIASILALKHGIIPPTINHFTDDPAFDPKINFTFNTAQKRDINIVQSNGFGFGGHNASVIFKKYED
ncbi:beta-ketoacyl-ACP synthase II [Mucilaginibacter rubeus]|uniref:3-oxoacyl-[acyl-carrier-protein] synthase 2 n=1 Tax=Mucilaginibacter rubeus TaxID=2027860 RepID=A0AAE6JIX3_9SPHI|nr:MULTISPECIES: beta-ketoacyl-ACP synthase II [Mucilaginibacter]QEM06293.1 beta-ketoacyl-ACP synthase II [Mucilaginibacter rubeus]QEM18876.1 beta-ketoacyl-ACP synthase II [Mucilaginibacter gossypii]QTE44581.1 beta-ketoacyl-ACP synthase II [Mucilaginibacter rubeus]QTE51179.1 beta-ketoacyl-ACP synthase II [Mucilaginibacter rubeus]QTE56267.1 beta-ketoacyl-ACP synthase II [Mucilaginibacter rubeus]